eukprot:SAG31_NODE_1302_length_8900_cov_4.460857_7_plen_364_part_00
MQTSCCSDILLRLLVVHVLGYWCWRMLFLVQVVLDLATAVKELVENSLDARATKIEVRLRDYGLETIEVSDNGEGICPANYGALALRHHTSKLAAFKDLEALDTFGFRGEALSALAALGDLTVTSRQKGQKCATRLEYDPGGLLGKQTATAREGGTTVLVSRLFHSLPVRHAELKRNSKKEFSKLMDVLNGYALVARRMRLTVTNMTAQGSKQTVLSSNGNGVLKDAITKVLGIKQLQNMQPVDATTLETEEALSIDGYVSKLGCGRRSGDRQFFSLNGRPVDLPWLSRCCNEVWRQYTSTNVPVIILDITARKDGCDINVTPDKRTVLIHAEDQVCALICDLVLAPAGLMLTDADSCAALAV